MVKKPTNAELQQQIADMAASLEVVEAERDEARNIAEETVDEANAAIAQMKGEAPPPPISKKGKAAIAATTENTGVAAPQQGQLVAEPMYAPPAQSPSSDRVGAFPAAGGPHGEKMKQLTQVRWFRNPEEREASQKRAMSHRWPHAAPNSVLIAAVGNSWKGDSWARVMDMADHAHKNGCIVEVREFQNRCFEPYDALGTMRNEIFTSALSGGYEFCMQIDNDVKPQPDTLYRLLNQDLPMIAPYVEEPPTQAEGGQPMRPRRVLHGPFREPFMGTYPVKWHVLTMVLYKTAFIGALGGNFWEDAIGADEGYHYQKSYQMTGVYPHVDSSIVLEAGGAPLYPLTVKKSGEWDRKGGVRDERLARFDSVPDRGPIWPGDPRVNDEGVYLPFMEFPEGFGRPPTDTAPPQQVVDEAKNAAQPAGQPNGS